MKRNIGEQDMILRLFLGIMLLDLSVDQALTSHWNIITSAIGVVLLATALSGFCPLYALFGIHSSHTKNGSSHQ